MRNAVRARLHTHRTFNASLIEAQEALLPWQMSAPRSIWNHFSNEDLGQKWGRAPPAQNMLVSKCVRGHRQTECTSFHRAILLCALAHSYFYIWMMSVCVDDIEMFDFMAQVSRIAKSLDNTFLPLADQHRTKWTNKHFHINWQKSLTFASDAWCVCHFLWQKSIITFENDCLWPGNDV